jgi:branched-chain amino acid aminotransferase
VEEGIFLFLEDHLSRFRNSVQHIGNNYNIDFKYIIDSLLKLNKSNDLRSGNVKLLIAFHPQSARDPVFIAIQSLHSYPTEIQYREGVMTSLFMEERERPNIKYLNSTLQEKCRNEITSRNVYEVLLVDHNGYITEGSKSNLFFIRGDSLYTAPAQRVLKGITREKIVEICREIGYPLIEENISVNSLNQFKAAFLSGTSPKVLPVASIDTLSFSVEDPLMSKIKAGYDALIGTYKTRIRQTDYRIDSL